MVSGTRKSGAERREETARAVLRILGEKGIAALTTTALADKVGVSSGALFRHFPSRDAMLDEAVAYALNRVEATFPDETLAPLARLMRLARDRIEVMGSDAGVAWLFVSEQAGQCLPPQAMRDLRDMAQRSREFVLSALRDGVLDGSIRGDIDPEILLVPVLGTIHALIGLEGIHDTTVRPRTVSAESVLGALKILLSPPALPDGRKTIEEGVGNGVGNEVGNKDHQ